MGMRWMALGPLRFSWQSASNGIHRGTYRTPSEIIEFISIYQLSIGISQPRETKLYHD